MVFEILSAGAGMEAIDEDNATFPSAGGNVVGEGMGHKHNLFEI